MPFNYVVAGVADMTRFSSLLLEIARWIAGPDRAQWIDAMQAEAVSIKGSASLWAIGCLWASVKDRIVRERSFIGAMLLVLFGPLLLSIVLVFPEGWLWRSQWLQQHWLAKTLVEHDGLLYLLPFTFLLGRIRPGRPSYVAAAICFPLTEFAPLIIFWIKFGKPSPLAWFGKGATWYMFSPAVGLTLAFLVALSGAWLGSKWSPRKQNPTD